MANTQKIAYSLWITLIIFLLFIFIFIIFTYTYFGTTIINDFCLYKALTNDFQCPSYCTDILGANACNFPPFICICPLDKNGNISNDCFKNDINNDNDNNIISNINDIEDLD